ncbi:MAG: hypothetical protein JRJ82_12880 [Deltaproteobacteria bacterium]|nr:hypothetical protein [Deltaproteobacteria bacterium]
MNIFLQKWLSRLANAGSKPTDTEDHRLRKATLTFLATIYCILSGLWCVAYLVLGLPLAACILLGYGLVSACTILFFFRTKRYGFFRFSQLILILIVPFLLQWTLGGFAASSAVIIWSILAPIGALMFAGTRQAFPWFLAYLLLMTLSGILDIRFAGRSESLAPSVMVIFFVLNTVGVSTIAFLLIRYFVRERERAMDALGRAHKEVSQDRERISKIKSILAHFVPSTAKDMIEKDPDRALQDKYIQDATVLFLDVEGFTSLVQKYPHEKINRTIESYFSMFFDIIQRMGGDINETAGDGMMVIFLDPDPHTHPGKAVQAALDIQKKCDEHSDTDDSDLLSFRRGLFGLHQNAGGGRGSMDLYRLGACHYPGGKAFRVWSRRPDIDRRGDSKSRQGGLPPDPHGQGPFEESG